MLPLPEVKAIEESFKESVVLITQAKSSLEIPGLATQLLKIEDQLVLCNWHYPNECLVKLIEMMESARYTIKSAGNSRT